MSPTELRLATRASPLAMAQSGAVARQIEAQFPSLRVELVPLTTTGDRILNQPLAEIGGKGLFTAELDAALLSGAVDLAVHSLKDLPTVDVDGLIIAAIPERADPRDVLIARQALPATDPIAALPPAARVGTASLRRRAQLLALRPDLTIEVLRGNVGTRLGKLESGAYDAILLAAAGLNRLGVTPDHAAPLAADAFLPAAGQGALALQCRADHASLIDILAALHHKETAACVTAERSFLNALDGSCRTPIGAYAICEGAAINLTGGLWDDAFSARFQESLPVAQASELGQGLAARIQDARSQHRKASR